MPSDVKPLTIGFSDPALLEAIKAWERDREAISRAVAQVAEFGISDGVRRAIQDMARMADENKKFVSSLRTAGMFPDLTQFQAISGLVGELALGSSHLRHIGLSPDVTSIGKALTTQLRNLTKDIGPLQGSGEQWRNYFTAFVDLEATATIGESLRTAAAITSLNFSSVDYDALFRGGASEPTVLGLLHGTSRFARRSAEFVETIETSPVDKELEALPAEGLSAHSHVLRTLASDEEVEIGKSDHESFLIEHLPKLSPTLLTNYRGMKAAMRRQDVDWWTQAGSSGRKLAIGILDAVAPHSVVVPWSITRGYELHDKTHAKRSAQVMWFSEQVSNPAYGKAVLAQLNALLKVVRYLNETQHTNGAEATIGSFESVVFDVETFANHLLRIWLIKLG